MRKILFLLISFSLFTAGCATTVSAIDIEVAHNYCYSYSYGKNGIKQDFEKAFHWCSKAAQMGATSAQTLLAELYFFGRGREVDLVKAVKLYEQAASLGHQHAQFMVYQVHNLYRDRESSTADKLKGFAYLKQAVEAGYPKAIDLYNSLYGQGATGVRVH